MSSSSAHQLAAWTLPPCLVVFYVWLGLGGTHWNIHVPIGFGGDALFYLAQSKATIEHGWWWTNPSIGAPFGYPALTFAQNTNVDQALVWIVGLFTAETGLAVNVTWLIMLGLSAVTASWGLRRLGVSPWGAGVAGVLFAVSPFALYRNLGHFSMGTYLFPFAATAALLLASSDRERPWRSREMAVPAAGCALLGFNYIYFAFFGAVLIIIGASVGAARLRSVVPLRSGAIFLGIIVLATTLNLIPNAMAWRQYGHPLGLTHGPAESEYYALKIRHLVSPTLDHWFPPFKAWQALEKAAEFPNENENRAARLGLVAAIGFLGLMAALIFPTTPRRDETGNRFLETALLTLGLVLLGTLGGFGSLFSLLVSSEIRAYNRLSAFIAFFALAALAMWVDRFTRMRSGRLRIGLWLVLLVVGLTDQRPAFGELVNEEPRAEQQFASVMAIGSALESRLADNAMVYQLPIRPFPLDPGIERMGPYDHFRPYLTTHRLRWSYPALTSDHLKWERDLQNTDETRLPRRLAELGFSAILIVRAGYADGGRRLAQKLQSDAGGATLIAANDDYVALDLRALRPAADGR